MTARRIQALGQLALVISLGCADHRAVVFSSTDPDYEAHELPQAAGECQADQDCIQRGCTGCIALDPVNVPPVCVYPRLDSDVGIGPVETSQASCGCQDMVCVWLR